MSDNTEDFKYISLQEKTKTQIFVQVIYWGSTVRSKPTGRKPGKMCFQKPSLSLIPQRVLEHKMHYRMYPALHWKEVPGLGLLSHLYPEAFDMLKNSPEKDSVVSLNQSTPTAARGWVQQLVKKFWVGYQKHQLRWRRKGSRYWGKINSHFWRSQEASFHIYWNDSIFSFCFIHFVSICWMSNEYSFFMAFIKKIRSLFVFNSIERIKKILIFSVLPYLPLACTYASYSQ